MVLFLTGNGPDLSHYSPAEAPLTPQDQRGPVCFMSARYVFTATTRDILSPSICFSWVNPATHQDAVLLSWLSAPKSSCIACYLVWQGHCGCLTGMNSEVETCTVCREASSGKVGLSFIAKKHPQPMNGMENMFNIDQLLHVCPYGLICPSVPKTHSKIGVLRLVMQKAAFI